MDLQYVSRVESWMAASVAYFAGRRVIPCGAGVEEPRLAVATAAPQTRPFEQCFEQRLEQVPRTSGTTSRRSTGMVSTDGRARRSSTTSVAWPWTLAALPPLPPLSSSDAPSDKLQPGSGCASRDAPSARCLGKIWRMSQWGCGVRERRAAGRPDVDRVVGQLA